MAEIRDIKPADPLWPRRRADKVRPDSERESQRPPQRRPRRRPLPEEDGSPKGGQIDEYA